MNTSYNYADFIGMNIDSKPYLDKQCSDSPPAKTDNNNNHQPTKPVNQRNDLKLTNKHSKPGL